MTSNTDDVAELSSTEWSQLSQEEKNRLTDDTEPSDDSELSVSYQRIAGEDTDEDFDAEHAVDQMKFYARKGDNSHAELWAKRLQEAGYNVEITDETIEIPGSQLEMTNFSQEEAHQLYEFYSQRDGYNEITSLLEQMTDND